MATTLSLARADTAFDGDTLRVTWDEGDLGVFPAITETTEAAEDDDPEGSDAETLDLPETDAPGDDTEPREVIDLVSESDGETDSESEDDDGGPGPAVRALIAAFTAAYEQDRAAKRRRTD